MLPFGRPFTYSLLGEFPGLVLALEPDVLVPAAEQGCATVHGAEILIQIFALAGVESRTLESSAANVTTRLLRTHSYESPLTTCRRIQRGNSNQQRVTEKVNL